MNRFWPFRHLGLKLLSVALAILLWIAVAGNQTVERAILAPIEMRQVPAGLGLQGDVPTSVGVRVRGTASVVNGLTAGDVVAVLDLRRAGAGERRLRLSPADVRAPFGVDVVEVIPDIVVVTFVDLGGPHEAAPPAANGKP